MNIGLIVPGFSADAADWCIPALRNLAGQLARSAGVRVVALRYPYRAARYSVCGADVLALGGAQRRGPASLALWRRALAVLIDEHRRRPFDRLHAFWATESGAIAALAARLLKIPCVVSLAGGELVGLREIGYGDQLRLGNRLKVRVALGAATAVTAGSAYMADLARPWLRLAALRRPLGVDLGLFSPGVGTLDHGPPRIVHVASLVPVKDQALLLRAAGLLHARRVAFRLDIAGAGPLEGQLRALAGRLGIAEQVRFLGAIEHDQLPNLYRGAAAFALSSRHEAQCMAALEAAACGVPVVGTAVGAIPELAPGGALPAPVGDAAALAEHLAGVLGDEGLGRRMGQAARARCEQAWGVEQCASALVQD
jgi:glycosyltransferase involved in cell wall biosynthesis